MKKLLTAFVLGAMVMLSGCSKVPAGNVGVKVYLLGGEKGVDSEVLGVGRYWIGFNEDLFLFPTFTQNYVWTLEEAEGSETDEVSDMLENKYKEKLIFTGTIMNKSNSASPTMFITVNSQTNTYTFVNYYKDQNLACIIDSGTMKLHTIEQKRQTL